MIDEVGVKMAKLCPKCGEELNQNEFCEHCKISVKVYDKIKMTSKLLYNQGLHLAKVRDLSSAINVLQRSVKFDKKNIDARNLLGLVYFEIGETVLALQQWVISKNLQPTDNLADGYLKIIQDNQTHLDKLNSAIKKYNQALQHIQQMSEDLAIIQLKKVISLNPKFIKAYALLALCYIKENQNDRAKKVLLKILSIDKDNYIARKYYDAISGDETVEETAEEEQKINYNDYRSPKLPVSLNSSFQQVILVIGGALIGLAVALFLILPSVSKHKDITISNLQDQVTTQTTELQDKTSALTDANQKNVELEQNQTQLTQENTQLKDIQTESAKVLTALQYQTAKDYDNAANALLSVDSTKLEGSDILSVYNRLKSDVYSVVALNSYNAGANYYFAKSYDKAIEQLNLTIKLLPDADYVDRAYYYRGASYYRLNQYNQAKSDLQYVLSNYPNSARINDVKWYLSLME